MTNEAKIEVNLTPELINDVVAKALIKSALGENVLKVAKKSVEECFKMDSNNFYHQSPVKRAIEEIVGEQVKESLKEHFMPEIKKRIKEAITEDVIILAVEHGIDEIYKKFGLR